ncbi:phosphotransferase family protein [Desulfoluna butyratoxydans]|uniref:Aminoglycoside phosphotransferase n=1 Tax=Desulfoluna butyratoxydans TaxID=231438 RepID=A0A4U8YLJ1_9BACT|nr:phosphotransferase family protein [Desulfoluna butyratoxydans]VFQ44019.1 aminoglycoside phosphotransferase [Desulfoluna butyratoxydans]
MKDTAQAIRDGEGLDEGKLYDCLVANIPGLSGPLTLTQFPSGFSNLTYLVRVGETEMVLRRPPFGARIKSAHDMGREYRILSALRPHFPYCPEPLYYTEDPEVMGCPFYVMERMEGIILRKDLPAGLAYTPAQAKGLCERVLDVQVALHGIDVEEAGLDFLGKPEGYVRRQVEGWSRRYRNARTDDAPDFEAVMEWLADHMPEDTPQPTIVHNDYKLDNIVLSEVDPMAIIGVLDWEMATYGDPLMDLGNSLAYWVEKDDPEEMQMIRLMPTNMDGALSRSEMVARYGRLTGRDVSRFDYYHCFGLFRLAVIAQQIYQRYHKGLTRDKRFAMLIFAVQILERAALSYVLNRKSMDHGR